MDEVINVQNRNDYYYNRVYLPLALNDTIAMQIKFTDNEKKKWIMKRMK